MENEINVKTKYWHKCQHCIQQHSTKKNKIKLFNKKKQKMKQKKVILSVNIEGVNPAQK